MVSSGSCKLVDVSTYASANGEDGGGMRNVKQIEATESEERERERDIHIHEHARRQVCRQAQAQSGLGR